jgi:flagellar L-ring protein FlgH
MKTLNKYTIFIVIVWLFSFMEMFGQFTQNSSRSLFSDVKAFKQGDALMVLIVESTQADNSAGTTDSRETQLSGGLDANSGSGNLNLDGTLKTGTSFTGKGQTTRKEQISSKLSARVVKVEDNGNLSIEGKRTTKVNGETQTIVIKGIVRPVDVLPNNSVYSYSILELTLFIEGDGTVSKIQEPGLITKFLRMLF